MRALVDECARAGGLTIASNADNMSRYVPFHETGNYIRDISTCVEKTIVSLVRYSKHHRQFQNIIASDPHHNFYFCIPTMYDPSMMHLCIIHEHRRIRRVCVSIDIHIQISPPTFLCTYKSYTNCTCWWKLRTTYAYANPIPGQKFPSGLSAQAWI